MERAHHFHDVGLFHDKFDLDNTTNSDPGPRELPADLLQFRVKFIFEELQELLGGLGLKLGNDLYSLAMTEGDVTEVVPDEAKQFDALLDLVYVIYGLAHLKGFPWEEGWDAVQAANMAKERASRVDQSDRGGTWDVIKPPGWVAPDIERLLRVHGWDV